MVKAVMKEFPGYYRKWTFIFKNAYIHNHNNMWSGKYIDLKMLYNNSSIFLLIITSELSVTNLYFRITFDKNYFICVGRRINKFSHVSLDSVVHRAIELVSDGLFSSDLAS